MKKRFLTGVVVFLTVVAVLASLSYAQNQNGKGGQKPAYYDAKLFTINFMELSATAEAMVLLRNKSINIIYESDQAVAAGINFIDVLDAVPGDGMNALWNEVQIVFNTGYAPHQFLSDTDILAAAATPEILLIPTTEIYRGSVVGHKKP